MSFSGKPEKLQEMTESITAAAGKTAGAMDKEENMEENM